jgi:hypothetical protein
MVPVSIAWMGLLASGLLAVVLPLQVAGIPTGPLIGYYQWLPALVFQTVLALWLLIKGVATPATQLSATYIASSLNQNQTGSSGRSLGPAGSAVFWADLGAALVLPMQRAPNDCRDHKVFYQRVVSA